MYSALLLRVGSQVLSAAMGGMAIFCLYYAAQVPNFDAAWWLLAQALICGGLASAIVYCKKRYLD